jgi:ubiquinone/menaquinone biosynthesis C-methylase UbiE
MWGVDAMEEVVQQCGPAMDLMHRRSQSSMRAFYNGISRLYLPIERLIDRILGEMEDRWIASLPGARTQSAIDYACGSGSFSLMLGRHFKSVEGRDASGKMLDSARRRAAAAGIPIVFRVGDVLSIEEADGSFDRVFMSYALHLFPPERIRDILRQLLRVARESVMIVDHPRKWGLGTALMEWMEGSYYDRFIRMDFQKIAAEIGARFFREWQTEKATILIFSKNEPV